MEREADASKSGKYTAAIGDLEPASECLGFSVCSQNECRAWSNPSAMADVRNVSIITDANSLPIPAQRACQLLRKFIQHVILLWFGIDIDEPLVTMFKK